MKNFIKFFAGLVIFTGFAAACYYFYKTYIEEPYDEDDDEEVDLDDFDDEDEKSEPERGYFNLDDVKKEAEKAESESKEETEE